MAIRYCKSVSEYKEERARRVHVRFLMNFSPATCSYEIVGNTVRVRDFTGDSVSVPLRDVL